MGRLIFPVGDREMTVTTCKCLRLNPPIKIFVNIVHNTRFNIERFLVYNFKIGRYRTHTDINFCSGNFTINPILFR